ncbi:MAG: inosine/xanthosine triphosphatase [Candidatus Nitrosocaldaceae archaeon]
MDVVVGSLNKVKIDAVKIAFEDFGFRFNIKGKAVNSNKQPLSIEDTINGAIYRAREALKDGADYGVGIEAGLMRVYDYNLNIHVAVVISDRIALGFGPAFQLPKRIESLVLQGIELDEAVETLLNIKDIGEKDGIISLMSNGRIDRKMLIVEAVKMALVKIINRVGENNSND